jgi:oligopeptide transport system substrate-binding protein
MFVVLAGCAKRETAVEAGIRTQTLLVGNAAEPITLDPQLCNWIVDQCIMMALFEGLTAIDEQTMQAVPAVAERWEVSVDGLVYTFHLRADAKWSNGDPVTAQDFAYSFRRILTPTLAAGYNYMLWPIRNAEAYCTGKIADFAQVGVEVIDARTLRLMLERPTPYLPLLAAHTTWFPVHRPTIEKFGKFDDRTSAWTRLGNLVGNGPFTLEKWQANVQVVVKKNPLHRDAARNRLERVVFFPTENPQVEERNFRAGQVHVTANLPTTKIAHYREKEPAVFRADPSLCLWWIRCNTARPALDNPKVRRALALAVDREAISRVIYCHSRSPAGQLIPPRCGGYEPRARLSTDFEQARRLLAEAGYAGGKGFPQLELQFADSFEMPKVAELIQETWRRELGVTLKLAQLESKVGIQNEQEQNYCLSLGGWIADYADPVTFLNVFLGKGGNNWTGWANTRYDTLLEQAANSPDQNQRMALFQEAEAVLVEECPIVPLAFDAQIYLKHPAVKGWVPSPLVIRRYQNVWLEAR